ncbi:MAG: protein-glutamate O-methyltransferase CheR [Bacillota bacterium]
MDTSYSLFCKRVEQLTGVDLSKYKPRQMERRLGTLMQRLGAQDYGQLAAMMQRQPDVLRQFMDFFTINVSEFFRNPERFEYLREYVLSPMLTEKRRLRVWSAGCAGGAETYSVAILLHELRALRTSRVVGTDVDRSALAFAQAGTYSGAFLRNLDESRLARYFKPAGEGQYTIRPEIKGYTEFKWGDLLQVPYDGGPWDLILCRNVVIYFTEEAKAMVFEDLVSALTPGGVLFIGGTETVTGPARAHLEPIAPFMYRKKHDSESKCRPVLGWSGKYAQEGGRAAPAPDGLPGANRKGQ